MTVYEKQFHVRWGDIDINQHLRNTAYLDMSADARMMYFAEHGFSMREFERLKVGPVIQRDELDYFKEMRLLEPIRVTLRIAGASADGSRWCLRNEFFRDDGKRVARVNSTGGWLDQVARRLVAPPEALMQLLRALESTEDFREMDSSLKKARE